MRKVPCGLCGRPAFGVTLHVKFCEECRSFHSFVRRLVFRMNKTVWRKEL
jgi:hypothetical protein